MKTFICKAYVKNIYNNGENFLQREYKADTVCQALEGFTQYLQSNNNLVSFRILSVEEA